MNGDDEERSNTKSDWSIWEIINEGDERYEFESTHLMEIERARHSIIEKNVCRVLKKD